MLFGRVKPEKFEEQSERIKALNLNRKVAEQLQIIRRVKRATYSVDLKVLSRQAMPGGIGSVKWWDP